MPAPKGANSDCLRAVNQLEPARIGWGVAEEPTQVFNRRWFLKASRGPIYGAHDNIEQVDTNPGYSGLLKPAGRSDGALPGVLARIIAGLRSDLSRSWTADEIMAMSGLGAAQTRRLFRKHLRASPRQWLTRERIIRAQSLILWNEASLAEIDDSYGSVEGYLREGLALGNPERERLRSLYLQP